MPVEVAVDLRRPSKDRFHAICSDVVGRAFVVHNSVGKLFDEDGFQRSLLLDVLDMGWTAVREVGIRVRHGIWAKEYFMDILVDGGVPLELKVVADLTPSHDAQLLNYLLLCDLGDGLLLNFGANSVQKRYVSTTLRRRDRVLDRVVQSDFVPVRHGCCRLVDSVAELIADVGTHLSRELYLEAITAIVTAGGGTGLADTPLTYRGRSVGSRPLLCLTPRIGIQFTTLNGGTSHMLTHLRRLLTNTPFRSIHWFNLSGRDMTVRTVRGN